MFMDEIETERLAQLAFNVYRNELNVIGANIKPIWVQLPPEMREAWRLVVVAIEAEVNSDSYS